MRTGRPCSAYRDLRGVSAGSFSCCRSPLRGKRGAGLRTRNIEQVAATLTPRPLDRFVLPCDGHTSRDASSWCRVMNNDPPNHPRDSSHRITSFCSPFMFQWPQSKEWGNGHARTGEMEPGSGGGEKAIEGRFARTYSAKTVVTTTGTRVHRAEAPHSCHHLLGGVPHKYATNCHCTVAQEHPRHRVKHNARGP